MVCESQVVKRAGSINDGGNFSVPKLKLEAREVEAQRSVFGPKEMCKEVGEESHELLRGVQ